MVGRTPWSAADALVGLPGGAANRQPPEMNADKQLSVYRR